MTNSIKEKVRDKFDPRIIIIALFLGILEFEIFAIPKNIVKIAARDAWISVLLGGVFVNLIALVLVKLAKKFPKENLIQYSKKIASRPVGFLISLLYILFWIIFLTLLVQNTAISNKVLFLPETPFFITIFSLIIGVLGIVPYGLAAVLRLYQLFLPFFLLPIFLIFFLAIPSLNFSYFLPLLANGFLPVLKGAVYYIGRFQGIEFLLFLVPFLKDSKKILKYTLLSVNFINLILLTFTCISLGILGVENIKYTIWPAIDTIGVIEIPGFPAERFELFLTLSWLIADYTTMCLYFYLISFSLIQIFNFNKKLIYYSLGILILATTYLIPNYAWTQIIRDYITYLTFLYIFFIPFTLYILATIRQKRGSIP